MALTLVVSAGNVAYAQSTNAAKEQVCRGVNTQTGGSCGNGGLELSNVIKGVLGILSLIAGVAAVIMIIISGIRYITSAGDANAISGAKKTLIYAVIGLIVVAVSQFIVQFVLQSSK